MNDKDNYRMALQTVGTKTIGLQRDAGVLHCPHKIHAAGLRRSDQADKRRKIKTP